MSCSEPGYGAHSADASVPLSLSMLLEGLMLYNREESSEMDFRP